MKAFNIEVSCWIICFLGFKKFWKQILDFVFMYIGTCMSVAQKILCLNL